MTQSGIDVELFLRNVVQRGDPQGGEARRFLRSHLRRIVAAYTGYYNECRTHLSLDKDPPNRRPIQRLGQLVAQPILGGLHNQYCRI